MIIILIPPTVAEIIVFSPSPIILFSRITHIGSIGKCPNVLYLNNI